MGQIGKPLTNQNLRRSGPSLVGRDPARSALIPREGDKANDWDLVLPQAHRKLGMREETIGYGPSKEKWEEFLKLERGIHPA